MGNLLEDGQTALVTVAVDRRGEDIAALLSNAATMIVTEGIPLDLGADFGRPIDNAPRRSPTASSPMADKGIGLPML